MDVSAPKTLGWVFFLHPLDWAAIGLLVLFLLLGLLRGAAWQTRRLLAVVTAFLISGLFSPAVSSILAPIVGKSSSASMLGIAYAFSFLGTLTFLALLLRFLKTPKAQARKQRLQEQNQTPDPPKRRFLGAGLGLLTASVIYLGGMTFFLLVSPEESAQRATASSRGAQISAKTISSLAGILPLEARETARTRLMNAERPR